MRNLLLLFLLVLIPMHYHSQVSEGLIAKYSFNNGNANDEQGSVDGTTNNTSLTTDRFGCEDHAYAFSGSDSSFISLGNNFSNVIAQADSSFSFSLWYKRNDTVNFIRPTLLSKYGNSVCGEDQREFVLLIDSNRVSFFYFTNLYFGDLRIIVGSTVVNDSDWHHIVINYDGSIDSNDGLDRVEIYLDNMLESTSIQAMYGSLGDIQSGNAHFSIGPPLNSYGGFCSDTSGTLDGKIDDFQLFNRVLSVEEIALLYNDPDPCQPNTINNIHSANSMIKIYPNPADNCIFISNENNLIINQTSIYNQIGQKVYYKNNPGDRIDISSLKSGIYIVELEYESGSDSVVLREKVLVE